MSAALFDRQVSSMASALIPILKDTQSWACRYEIAWYVSRCEMAGFCKTDEMRQLCAQRWMAGKRKVSPPGHKRRKRAASLMRKMLGNPPVELLAAVSAALKTDAARQYAEGNLKALNALVGMVLKAFKTDAGVVRQLLIAAQGVKS